MRSGSDDAGDAYCRGSHGDGAGEPGADEAHGAAQLRPEDDQRPRRRGAGAGAAARRCGRASVIAGRGRRPTSCALKEFPSLIWWSGLCTGALIVCPRLFTDLYCS